MSDSRHQLRILHVSDLHERGSEEDAGWRRQRVLGEAWEENLAHLLEDGPVDLVCFTGDAAFSGKADEFRAVTGFFTGLLGRLRLGVERLFLVPGNHDVDRKVEPDAWERLRNLLFEVDALRAARWLAGRGSAPPGIEDGWRDAVLARQGAYRGWLEELGRRELLPAGSPHGHLGYRATLRLPRLGFPVHVIGLDTAWLCGDGSDATRLRVTDEQVGRLATDEGQKLDGLRLVLMHHPFGELADGAEVRRLLAAHTDALLRGHLHVPELGTWSDWDGRQLHPLAAGCLFDSARADRYRNGCQLLTLHLDEAGGLRQVDLRLRSFSPSGGHWHDDDGLYHGSRGGRLSRVLAPAPCRSGGGAAMANPYDTQHPAVPPRFAGRRELLLRLEDALHGGKSLSLVGDRRIGKSSLLATWGQKLQELGWPYRHLDGQRTEGAAVAAFVAAVTGQPAPAEAEAAADQLERWARQAGAPGRVPVLLVDEAEVLVRSFDLRFFERLRGMMDHLALCFASRRELDLLFREMRQVTSPFHNRMNAHWLGLLEADAAEELIAQGQTLLSPDDATLQRRLAGRHPFYLQLLGHHLADARRSGTPRRDVLDSFHVEAGGHLRSLWQHLTERDRFTLLGLRDGRHVGVHRSLRLRGLLTEDDQPFGEVLAEFLREQP